MTYSDIYNNWLADSRLNGEAKAELETIKGNEKEIEYRFGAELEFGTAGMRGIIGYGTKYDERIHRKTRYAGPCGIYQNPRRRRYAARSCNLLRYKT